MYIKKGMVKMKKMRLISILLTVVLMLGMLAGCTQEPKETTPPAPETTEAPTEAPTAAPTEPPVEQLDLEALYNQGMEVLAQMGSDAPVLFPELNIDYLNCFYPGIADVEMKQFYAGVAPVTNAPFEIILVEVANEADVQTVLDLFHARADLASGDTSYPENAEAWMNNCKITSRGCYVFLAVLMDPCEVPAEFILD